MPKVPTDITQIGLLFIVNETQSRDKVSRQSLVYDETDHTTLTNHSSQKASQTVCPRRNGGVGVPSLPSSFSHRIFWELFFARSTVTSLRGAVPSDLDVARWSPLRPRVQIQSCVNKLDPAPVSLWRIVDGNVPRYISAQNTSYQIKNISHINCVIFSLFH